MKYDFWFWFDELGVEHVELSGRVGPDFHRHADAGALVVANARGDVRKVIRIFAEVLLEHLAVPPEATPDDYRIIV